MAKGQLPLTNPPDWVCTLLVIIALIGKYWFLFFLAIGIFALYHFVKD